MKRLAVLLAILVGCAAEPEVEPEVTPEPAAEATPEATPEATTPEAATPPPVQKLTTGEDLPSIDVLPDPATFPDTPKGLVNGAFTPEMAHTDLRTGEPFKLSDWTGPTAEAPYDALVVGFTASWCGPCKQSYPYLQQMKEEHAGRLEVVLVTMDATVDAKAKHVEVVEASGLEAPLLDPSVDTIRAWLGRKQNVPHFYIVNRIGEILVQDRGFGNNVKRVMPGQIRYALNHPEYVVRK